MSEKNRPQPDKGVKKMKVLMGTKNPGKIEGAKQAFEKYFDEVEVQGIAVESEVSNQPFDADIVKGAKNRVKNLKKYAMENELEVDYFVASEAGITSWFGNWIDFNVAVVENAGGFQSVGISQGFPVPESELRKGNG